MQCSERMWLVGTSYWKTSPRKLMNMASTLIFIDFSRDVFVSKLASELGFVSDAAQKFVKNRPPQENVCPESCPHWFVEGPLLIPHYIQNRLDNGSAISVNDYSCGWMPSTTLAWTGHIWWLFGCREKWCFLCKSKVDNICFCIS